MTRTREVKGRNPLKGSSPDPLRRQRRPLRSAEISSGPTNLNTGSSPVGSLGSSSSPPLRLSRQRAITRLRKRAAQPSRLNRSQLLGSVLLRGLSLSIVLGLMMAGLSQLLQSTPPALPERTLTPTGSTEAGDSLLSPLATDSSAGERIPALQERLAALAAQPGLTAGALFWDVETGNFAGVQPDQAFPAASVIKIPILLAFFQAVETGQVQMDEMLTLREDLKGGGAGVLQTRAIGSQVSALEAATLMGTVSDNFATNLIIDRLGGREALNQKFRQWGLQHTQISWWLPDLEGTNTSSPRDMVWLLSQVEQGRMLNRRNRDRFLDILWRTQRPSYFRPSLGQEVRIAHKTGTLRSVVGDAGIIDLPNGRRYLAAVWVKRETPNDAKAEELIANLSQAAYEYWSVNQDPQ
ncbi:serine hydrolase [Thermostichus vulcanus]|uniref:Serine hydrolase n=1 Tax=Thermostichus vulcanus str. 'Rupite' TaxID=2813851 RepID=A0ABT0CBK6_THEVL|nr:serine hydrolase [Thermostichus vulcanus]MCJ2543131.1 serine hydrolase [Thermostichus vulcanus str. 'Rupite']